MAEKKKKKIPKSLIISLLFCFGLFFVVVIGCIAIMFLSPGTEILGFQYVNYTTPLTKIYTNSTNSISSVKAVKILTDCSSINVTAGEEASQISVLYNRKIYGFVKSENSQIVFSDKIISSFSFEQDDLPGLYKTFVLNITEPEGWVSYDESSLNISLPSNISFEVIYLSSKKGNITYSSSSTASLSTENLHLTSGDGNLTIATTQPIDNYYLKTNQGNVNFSSPPPAAQKVKFESNGGSLNLTNANKNATLTLSQELFITGNATVAIDILNADLEIHSTGGRFSFGQIGNSSNEKRVKINAASTTFNFGKIYGLFTLSGNLTESNNNLSLSKLVNSSENNVNINTGKGNVIIEEVNSPSLSISTTSGNISVRKISISTTVRAYSTSGNISLSYVESSFRQPNTSVKVFTKTGSVSLANISGFFQVEVMENSAFSRLDISLCAICYDSASQEINLIKAKNRNVLLSFKGYEDDLICRILSKEQVDFPDEIISQINPSDYDYISNESYPYEYRVGYESPSNDIGSIYDGKGKVFIDGSGKVSISF